MKKLFVMLVIGALLMVAGQAFADAELVYNGWTYDDLNDEYDHSYTLTNYGGIEDLYDWEVSWEYSAAWIRADGPDNWAVNWNGPLMTWETSSAPCTIDQEIGDWHIYAGTPQIGDASITYTNINHEVVSSGTVSMPLPEPGSLSLLALGSLALLRRRRR